MAQNSEASTRCLGSATSGDIKQLVEEFREERADDIAQLADRAGRSGERLAITERERDPWRDYAKELERRCLVEGGAVPPVPNEI
ncbi:hypothetical protein MGN01_46150 [Methylobacterium gnaphalii]|uniref:Uncharacterized protein n=1 Tax=Methylobacterium gnaphalii TaxID=1010610 RepID=A0A512JS42_9HYPH|nr:hypothetical protein MGN01_46150 [Methylobacterium gnaphalii]